MQELVWYLELSWSHVNIILILNDFVRTSVVSSNFFILNKVPKNDNNFTCVFQLLSGLDQIIGTKDPCVLIFCHFSMSVLV